MTTRADTFNIPNNLCRDVTVNITDENNAKYSKIRE